MAIYRLPQYRTTTLAVPGGITNSQTTGIILSTIPADIEVNYAGVLALTWANPVDEDAIEYITYTSINSGTKELGGVTRGQEGFSARAHNNGATITWVISKSHINNPADRLTSVDPILVEDPNGNEILLTTYVSSAVNYLRVKNSATGNGPEVQALGDDTNIDLILQAKGTGAYLLKGTATSAAEIRLAEDTDNGTNYMGFKAPAAVTTSTTFTLPNGDGASGQTLTTNGSGTLSWTSSIGQSGTMLNGQIVPSVTSNNLTVALKGMDGNDPSAANPVYVRIDNTVRSVTSALSATHNAGTNWGDAGSTELAAKEIDWFVYLQWDSNSSAVRIGYSRIPHANIMSDFNLVSYTSDKTILGDVDYSATTDSVVLIGRFAATLSAGAGYTWTVPTFTAVNLIQRPIFETRWLTYLPVVTGTTGQPSSYSNARYKIRYQSCNVFVNMGSSPTSNSTAKTISLPFTVGSSVAANAYWFVQGYDNGAWQTAHSALVLVGGSKLPSVWKTLASANWTASGSWQLEIPNMTYEI